MTNKGTVILLTNFKSVVSAEIEDMNINPNSNGSIILEHLSRVKSVRAFKGAMEKFNYSEDYFDYTTAPIWLVVKRLRDIHFRAGSYFKHWFTDYIYFLNISLFKIKVTDMDGKILWLFPGEIAIYYLGKFYASYNYHAQAYAELPIQTLEPVPVFK